MIKAYRKRRGNRDRGQFTDELCYDYHIHTFHIKLKGK